MALSRRQFIGRAGLFGIAAVAPLQALYARPARAQSFTVAGFGPLVPDPAGILDLPAGFTYRSLSSRGETMSDGTLVASGHDGMATFRGKGATTILIRNHELSPTSSTAVVAPNGQTYDPLCKGGTTTLVIAPGPERQLVSHYTSLAGTYRNCAGGPTPWGSYITCEEDTSTPATTSTVSAFHGYNFEVPRLAPGAVTPVPLVAMGRFNHEAIAVDPATGIVYQTEDRGDSLFYRFIPTQPRNLAAGGVLEAMRIVGQPQVNTKNGFPVNQVFQVDWVRIDEPNPATDTVRAEGFSKGAALISRGEGAFYANGEIYFVSTNGGTASRGQVWRYIPGATAAEGGTIELFTEPNNSAILDGPDNIVVAPFGDLLLMEDGSSTQFVVGVTPQGGLYQFARNAASTSEFAGGCFSPDGETFFVNVQSPGVTFAIWGPWANRVS
ncbi:MAG: DUF839 domain-containing protein [Gemmatimonadaceae bacterium]|nr:DUF839 domain-containing protein [Gloeobacterales cyanobacterium ES-bin-141]